MLLPRLSTSTRVDNRGYYDNYLIIFYNISEVKLYT